LCLSSIICGLETDTVETIRTMKNFALDSGTILAQFTFYHPYPGTKDFHEMLTDIKNREKPNGIQKHQTKIRNERFWLKATNEVDMMTHANISREDLLAENKKCWDVFYAPREVWKRVNRGRSKGWPFVGKFTYLLLCLVFRRIYGGQGMAADGVRKKRLGLVTRGLIKIGTTTYNHYYRKRLGVRVGQPLAQPSAAEHIAEPNLEMVPVGSSETGAKIERIGR
jgi:hypothetical protein